MYILKKNQQDIRQLSNHNTKEYWQLINSINKKRDEILIEIETLRDYFMSMNIDDSGSQNVTAPEPSIDQNGVSSEGTAFSIPPSALNDAI